MRNITVITQLGRVDRAFQDDVDEIPVQPVSSPPSREECALTVPKFCLNPRNPSSRNELWASIRNDIVRQTMMLKNVAKDQG
jgi:hypothetical protein